MRGVLENNGHSIVFQLKERLDDPPESPSPSSPSQSSISSHSQHHAPHDAHFVNISGGPLSYSYSFESIHLHFGRSDGIGSEHTISGLSFAGEVSHTHQIPLIAHPITYHVLSFGEERFSVWTSCQSCRPKAAAAEKSEIPS